jgi:hypothetical protein
MSLVVTSLTSSSTAGASIGGFTTASISPAGNSLLVLWVSGFDGASAQDFTVNSVTGLGLTWTRAELGTAGATPKGDLEAWTAECGASPGSGAITVAATVSNINGGFGWDVDQVTGQDPTTPVVVSNIQQTKNSSAASSATFNTAGSSLNLFLLMSTVLIGTGQSVTQTASETPAWTQLAQVQSNTASQNGVSLQTQVSPDVTHLTAGATWTGSHSWGTIGLEIAASGPVEHDAAASLSGSGNLTAGASKTVPAAASLSGSGTLTAAASKTVPAAAALSGQGTLTAGVVKEVDAAAALSGIGTLTATAAKQVPAAAALSGSGTLTAAATTEADAAAALSGVGTLTAAARASHLQAAAALSGIGILTAAASVHRQARVILVTLGRARLPWSLGHARNS